MKTAEVVLGDYESAMGDCLLRIEKSGSDIIVTMVDRDLDMFYEYTLGDGGPKLVKHRIGNVNEPGPNQ